MSQFFYQQKQAWANLHKKTGFVTTVVTTMGTTLGALLCILTLAYLLIFQPLPYPQQARLYNVEHAVSDKSGEVNARSFTYPSLIHLYKNQEVFEQSAIIQYSRDVLTSLPHQPTMNIGYVSPEWFELLGTKLALGRLFEQTESLDTHNPVAILSYKTWQDEFSGSSEILNKKVNFSGVSFRIIGVIDKDFIEPQIHETGRNSAVWLPWDYNQDNRIKDSWGNISGALTFVGKLKNDININQAEQIITPLINGAWKSNVTDIPFFSGWNIKMEIESFQQVILGESQNTVYLLLAGVFGLIVIACANIANLFMSRTAEQQRQLAIYAALGAKKSHLFKGLLAESGLLMAMSVIVALVIASLGFYILQHFLDQVLPRVNELSINSTTLISAVLFATIFALFFAGLSSKMINYKALNSILQSSGKGTGIQVSKKIRQFLIVSQVAIATVLVFANASLFKESVNTINDPIGFSVNDMMHLSLSVSAEDFPPRDELEPLMTEFRSKLSQLPQVDEISVTTTPLNGFGLWTLTSVKDNVHYTPESKSADEKIFSMLDQTLLEGDFFSKADIKNRARKFVINDVFAKKINPNGSALGMQISSGRGDPFTIIGIVKGIKLPGRSDIPNRAYSTGSLANSSMTIKLKPNQILTREQVVKVLKEVSSLFAIFELDNLEETQKKQLFAQYTTAITTAVLAIITLFLASIGLYGILSYGTQMRRFELGTRMAIGAKRKHLICMIIKDNASVIILGIISSIIIMLALYIGYSEALASYITPALIPIFIVTLLAIILLSLFGCYWPLRQYINQPAVHSLRGSD